MVKIGSPEIIRNIVKLNFYKVDTWITLYIPFIIMFFLIVIMSVNAYLYMKTNIFKTLHGDKINYSGNLMILRNDIHRFISDFMFIGVIVFISEYILRGQASLAFKSLTQPQTLFNLFFIFSIYLVLMAFMGRGITSIIISTISLILIISNFIKIKFFDEPFYPWEVYLIRDALLIAKDYINIKLIALIAAAIVLIIVIVHYFKKRFGKIVKLNSSFMVLPFAIILIIANIAITNNYSILSELDIGKSCYVGKDGLLQNGLFVQNYFYLTDLKKYLNKEPQGYSYEKMKDINDKLKKRDDRRKEEGEKPNVVVIMGETFWDPTQMEEVTFSEDIVENLKKYKTGNIMAPVFGGGTANTEFEVLTGLSNYTTAPGVIPYNVYLRRSTPSIATVFKENDYRTTAIHPNVGEFYNRNKVYGYLGFDEFIDVKGFNEKEDIKGNYVSDDKLVDKILGILDSSEDPQFIFAVTIQNHDPYSEKYDNFEVTAESEKLDHVDKTILSGYAQGIYDGDRSLGKLIDSLEKSHKPTIVYYFGDHLPTLGYPKDIFEIYTKLNYFNSEDNTRKDPRLYTTPLASWSNYKEMNKFEEVVSPVQLSYDILKSANLIFPSYFNILDLMREKHPVLHQAFPEKIDMEDELIKEYNFIQYDILFGKQHLTEINESEKSESWRIE